MNPRKSMQDFHGGAVPRGKAMTGEARVLTNHEYSNGRKTSKHDREYWNWLHRVEAEAERDKR